MQIRIKNNMSDWILSSSTIVILAAFVLCGCTGSDGQKDATKASGRAANPTDTLFSRQTAMNMYAYQPVRALQILDTAVMMGNVGEVQADQCRARIYSLTLMHEQMDSLLGGSKDVRLDSAEVLGERLLQNDSIKSNLMRLRDVLEILAYTERMRDDTLGWIERSRQLTDVCHQIGSEAEVDALRTDAEIGTALYAIGKREEGMEKIDSVITVLSEKQGTFDALDALIIAFKRKIVILASISQYAETLPLSYQIIELLDDYEAHPDKYHDGSHREPKTAENRADYIRFYRTQAQGHLATALASLGKQDDVFATFHLIEDGVRAATSREHTARYNSLKHQMEAERQQAIAKRAIQTTVIIGIMTLLILALAVTVIFKNRAIVRKNRLLAQQMAEHVKHEKMYREELLEQMPPQEEASPTDLNTLNDEQLFRHLREVIKRDQLYLAPDFDRQKVVKMFQLTNHRVGSAFARGSEFSSLADFIRDCRLEYSCLLLTTRPDLSIKEVAAMSGYNYASTYSTDFKNHYTMTPTSYRELQTGK